MELIYKNHLPHRCLYEYALNNSVLQIFKYYDDVFDKDGKQYDRFLCIDWNDVEWKIYREHKYSPKGKIFEENEMEWST